MELELEQCTIRDWRLNDIESLAKYANNRRVWLGLRDLFPHPYGIDDAKDFITCALNEEPTTEFCIDIDGAAAGGIGLRPSEMFIGTPRHLVIVWKKNSGVKAS